jgi:hypothetical protein
MLGVAGFIQYCTQVLTDPTLLPHADLLVPLLPRPPLAPCAAVERALARTHAPGQAPAQLLPADAALRTSPRPLHPPDALVRAHVQWAVAVHVGHVRPAAPRAVPEHVLDRRRVAGAHRRVQAGLPPAPGHVQHPRAQLLHQSAQHLHSTLSARRAGAVRHQVALQRRQQAGDVLAGHAVCRQQRHHRQAAAAVPAQSTTCFRTQKQPAATELL